MRKYDLELNTYLQLGAIHKNAFAVLPLEPKKKTQRFVVGDDSHTLQMFEFKKGSLTQTWKTEQMDREISHITISESNKKVNTFCSSGHSIRGINKKGKEFFKFDTNHTEDIQNLHVHGSNLWSAGDYILNSYKGSKNGIEDNFYYLSDDKIYDMVIQNVSGSSVFNAILG